MSNKSKAIDKILWLVATQMTGPGRGTANIAKAQMLLAKAEKELAVYRNARRETLIECAEIACCAMLYHPGDGTPVLTGEAQSVAKEIAAAIRLLYE